MKTRAILAASLLAALSSPAMGQVWLPAEGIWQIDGANGSGLTLDVRDSAIGIGLYTYDDEGNATWYSGAGTLAGGALHGELTRFGHGDGDTPNAVGTLNFSLEFTGGATGSLSIGDAEPLTVRHFAFGADYIGGLDFGAAGDVTAVPDLRGRWVIAPTGPDQGGSIDVVFRSVTTAERSVEFTTTSDPEAVHTEGGYIFTCAPQPNLEMPTDRCHLSHISAPPASEFTPNIGGYLEPADLSATRLAGATSDFIAFRVPGGLDVPQSGIWQIAGRFGEGVTLDVRNNVAAIGVYGYDEAGNATWSLATGPLARVSGSYVMEADLLTFTGGSCLGCDHTDATVDDTRTVRVDFIGATRARVTIGDGEPLSLSLLPFGAQYLDKPFAGDPDAEEFGTHALPLLAGSWVQAGVYATTAVDAEPTYPAVTFTYDDVDAASLDGEAYNVLLAMPGGTWEPEDGAAAPSLGCEVGIGDDVADCDLIHPGSTEPPTEPRSIADLVPWNISGNRMSGVNTDNGVTLEAVYVFRIPPQPQSAPAE